MHFYALSPALYASSEHSYKCTSNFLPRYMVNVTCKTSLHDTDNSRELEQSK